MLNAAKTSKDAGTMELGISFDGFLVGLETVSAGVSLLIRDATTILPGTARRLLGCSSCQSEP